LINTQLIPQYCLQFQNGFFQQGFSSAIGVLFKKFQDLQIQADAYKSNQTKLFELLGAGTQPSTDVNSASIMEIFLSA